MNNNKVVATVGNREITDLDIQLLLRSIEPQKAMQLQNEEGQKRLVDELINQELFYLDAIENELEKDELYQKELQRVVENFLKHYAIQQLISTVKIEEKEVEDFYSTHTEQFQKPATTKASHILVDSEEKVEEILKELEEGLTFEDAAKKYSTCPSKAQGGDLGFFARGQMVPEFEEAVFSMKENEVSKGVKTQFGYHIIKVVEHKPEEVRSLNEVKSQLTQQLMAQKQQELYFDKINKLKDKYEIKVNPL